MTVTHADFNTQEPRAVFFDSEYSAAMLLSELLGKKFRAMGIPWTVSDVRTVERVFSHVNDIAVEVAMDLVTKPTDLDDDGTLHVLTMTVPPAMGKS